MTTTFAPNPSNMAPPWDLTEYNAENWTAGSLARVYFRQSSDGVNFLVTPVYLHPLDAARALQIAPFEWAATKTGFTAWKAGYTNSTQSPGGRGRLLGGTVAIG